MLVWPVSALPVGNYAHKEGTEIEQLCQAGNNPVVAVKAARLSNFGGRSLGTISSSHVTMETYNIPEANQVRAW